MIQDLIQGEDLFKIYCDDFAELNMEPPQIWKQHNYDELLKPKYNPDYFTQDKGQENVSCWCIHHLEQHILNAFEDWTLAKICFHFHVISYFVI